MQAEIIYLYIISGAGDELIKLLGEHNPKDALPSSIYKLKKAYSLNVDVVKYCGVCYIEVTDLCDMTARIRGVAAQMKVFDFFYGLVLGELLLRHSDNLSRALQHSSISAAEGQVIAKMMLNTLRSLRCDDSFNLFWQKVTKMADELEVSAPQLPHQRQIPKHYEDGTAPAKFHATVMEHYRRDNI